MIPSKLPNVGLSIFAVMSRMAEEYKAMNLAQGFPDFNCSEELIDLVNKYMRQGKNQYAPMEGVLALREQLSSKIEQMYGRYYHPETEITITAGATQALYSAISAVVREDDEVIIIEPAYDSYVPAIRANGGRPIFVELKAPDYTIDWNDVNKAITARTRLIIINTPHNPTGTMLTADDLEKLSKALAGSKIVVLSDEVYEHIVFDGQAHQSVARFPKLAERSMVVSSFGKTYHNTGWKMGYCAAPSELMKEFRKIHQFQVFSVNSPIQHAYAEYMQRHTDYSELAKFYQEKRDYFCNLLKNSRFTFTPAQGTYFQLLNFETISDMKDKDFATKLIQEYGIASIPVSPFYHDTTDNHVLRFCFAKSNETLEQAAEKLLRLGKKIIS